MKLYKRKIASTSLAIAIILSTCTSSFNTFAYENDEVSNVKNNNEYVDNKIEQSEEESIDSNDKDNISTSSDINDDSVENNTAINKKTLDNIINNEQLTGVDDSTITTLEDKNNNQEITEGDFKFMPGEDPLTGHTGVITAYTGTSKDVSIPKEIAGHKVLAIGNEVFKDKKLIKVDIPEGIEYIGKNAFENNVISEIYIPKSVNKIDTEAFLKVNNSTSKETIITGMLGVTELEDGTFGEILKLSLEIPSLTSINKFAFIPEPNYVHSTSMYVKLYTKNNNKNNFQSVQGLYIVDPATVRVSYIDEVTNNLLKKEINYIAPVSTNYDRNKPVEKFYQIGGKSKKYKALENIKDYLTPQNELDTDINNLINNINFNYKPISNHIKISVENKNISGKVLSGSDGLAKAKVIIYKDVSKEPRMPSWEKISDLETNNDGEYKFEFKEGKIGEKDTLKFTTSYEGSDYKGDANDYFITIKDGVGYSIEKVESLSPIYVKAGKGYTLPKKVKVTYTNGNEKEETIYWDYTTSDNINKDKPGEYWMRGKISVFEYGNSSKYENVKNVYLKINITENENINTTDKNELSIKIEKAMEILDSTKISEDGSDVVATTHWVTKDDKNKFYEEIIKAKKVKENPEVNQKQVDDAITDLEKAIQSFNDSKKLGTLNSQSNATATYNMIVRADYLKEENMKGFSVKLYNPATKKEEKWSEVEPVKLIGTGEKTDEFQYTFTLSPGTWHVIAPEGYIVTDSDGIERASSPTVTVTGGNYTFNSDFRFVKGFEVSYDLGKHGYTKDSTKQYYLKGEHWDRLPRPSVIPYPGYIFEGWQDENGNKINEFLSFEKDTKLKAIYSKETGEINKNTKVGGVWTVGDFEYAEEKNVESLKGQWKVIGFSLTGKEKIAKHYDLWIPHVTPNGEPVTIIGEKFVNGESEVMKGSFANYGINELHLPDSITDIYGWAFQGNHIKSLDLSTNTKLDTIGVFAFWHCGLESVNLPNNIKFIQNGAFQENKLTEVNVPGSVKIIRTTTFEANRLQKVILNEGTEEIDKHSFKNNRLKTINLPNSVKKVHTDAFAENSGLNQYLGKVGLVIGNGNENPNNIKNGNTFIVNPNVGSDDKKEKENLRNYLLAIENNYNATFTSKDGSDVPRDEKWLSPEIKAEMKEALYAGYYAYYDDTSSSISSQELKKPKFSVEQATSMLQSVGLKAKDKVKSGSAVPLRRESLHLMIGIPGVEYAKDLKNYHQDTYVLTDRNNPNSRAYSYSKVLDAEPNIAHVLFNIPEGNYELKAPVGMVYTHQEGVLNGKIIPDESTYVNVPRIKPIEIGYSAEEGCVLIYDLMDKGVSDDQLYETVMRETGAVHSPLVKSLDGYIFEGWSLDGEKVIDIKGMNTSGNRILKAVYREDKSGNSTDETKKISEELVKEADELLKETKISKDGLDIKASDNWIIKGEYDKLSSILDDVKENSKSASEDKLKEYNILLKNQLDIFKQNMSKGRIEKIDKQYLKKMIKNLTESLNSIATSEDGTDISEHERWIRMSDKNEYLAKINALSEKVDALSDTDTGELLYEELNNIKLDIQTKVKFGKKLDEKPDTPENPGEDDEKPDTPGQENNTIKKKKNELEKLIKVAEEKMSKTKKSKDGKDIERTDFWSSIEAHEDIYSSIVNANFVIEDEKASENEIDKSLSKLKESLDNFISSTKNGLKTEVVETHKPISKSENTEPEKDKSTNKIGESVRISGADRIETAIKISKRYYQASEYTIIVGENAFADSLSASVLAGSLKAPILLNNKNRLNGSVKNEIERLQSKKVIVIGGENVISKDVIRELYNKGISVEVISGKDRYETSAEVAKKIAKINGGYDSVVVASGEVFADALSVSPFASKNSIPIVLVSKDDITPETKKAISMSKTGKVLAIGGNNAISDSLNSKLGSNVERIYGKDRYETSALIAQKKFNNSKNGFLASGETYADALVIGSIAGHINSPVILTPSDSYEHSIKNYINHSKIEKLMIVGGVKSVSDSAVDFLTEK